MTNPRLSRERPWNRRPAPVDRFPWPVNICRGFFNHRSINVIRAGCRAPDRQTLRTSLLNSIGASKMWFRHTSLPPYVAGNAVRAGKGSFLTGKTPVLPGIAPRPTGGMYSPPAQTASQTSHRHRMSATDSRQICSNKKVTPRRLIP
jgi:hypothetical protein